MVTQKRIATSRYINVNLLFRFRLTCSGYIRLHHRPGTRLAADTRRVAAFRAHVTELFANNAAEADHRRLKVRLPPMCGLKRLRCAE